MLRVCHCSEDAAEYAVSAGNFTKQVIRRIEGSAIYRPKANFTKQFVAFRFDDRGNRLLTLDSAKNGGMHKNGAAAAALKINGESASRQESALQYVQGFA